MNDAGENNENRPVEEDSAPTASAGPGMVGVGEQIGRYKLLKVLGEGAATGHGIDQTGEVKTDIASRREGVRT